MAVSDQVVIVLCIIVGSISIFFWLRQRKSKQAKNIISSLDEISARVAKKLAEWQCKVSDSKHLLTGDSWHDSAGKEEFVTAVYDGNIPDYLWYAIGEEKLSSDDIDALYKLFWNKAPNYGDMELHVSGHPEVKTSLRIRNPKHFVTEIVVNGKKCPLYQTGHSVFGASETGCISFLGLYNKEAIA